MGKWHHYTNDVITFCSWLPSLETKPTSTGSVDSVFYSRKYDKVGSLPPQKVCKHISEAGWKMCISCFLGTQSPGHGDFEKTSDVVSAGQLLLTDTSKPKFVFHFRSVIASRFQNDHDWWVTVRCRASGRPVLSIESLRLSPRERQEVRKPLCYPNDIAVLKFGTHEETPYWWGEKKADKCNPIADS